MLLYTIVYLIRNTLFNHFSTKKVYNTQNVTLQKLEIKSWQKYRINYYDECNKNSHKEDYKMLLHKSLLNL